MQHAKKFMIATLSRLLWKWNMSVFYRSLNFFFELFQSFNIWDLISQQDLRSDPVGSLLGIALTFLKCTYYVFTFFEGFRSGRFSKRTHIWRSIGTSLDRNYLLLLLVIIANSFLQLFFSFLYLFNKQHLLIIQYSNKIRDLYKVFEGFYRSWQWQVYQEKEHTHCLYKFTISRW